MNKLPLNLLFIFALIIAWPLIKEINFLTDISFISGKWSPWDSLIINPIQVLLLIYLCYLSYKNSTSTKIITIIALMISFYSLINNFSPTINLVITINTLIILNYDKLKKTTHKPLIILLGLQTSIAVIQLLLQQDLGLQLIGEPQISENIKGIAKLSFQEGLTIIRSYGTFAHPNILAGFLIVSYFIIDRTSQIKHQKTIKLLILTGIICTLSRAIIVLPLIFLISYWHQIKLKYKELIILIIIAITILGIRQQSHHTEISNQERINQLQNFTQQETELTTKSRPWETSPIHLGYLELIKKTPITSILFTLSLIIFFSKKPNRNNWAAIACLSLGIFDHYLFTLPIGNFILLLTIIIQQKTAKPHDQKAPRDEPAKAQFAL